MAPKAHNTANGFGILLLVFVLLFCYHTEGRTLGIRDGNASVPSGGRERVSINSDWKFSRFTTNPDSLSYAKLKAWILPCGNEFINGNKHAKPTGDSPGADVKYAQATFDDTDWEAVRLPHDWAIKGPFGAPGIGGGMGRLPSDGVGWYRRQISMSSEDVGKTIFLDIDGAMSYSAVWLNGNLVGGWPYGYNSFRLDLTSYMKTGDNILAVRLDNAASSSRWYPGAGLYRNVWLVKVNPVHVGQYGTFIMTPTISATSATVNLVVQVENTGKDSKQVDVETKVYVADSKTLQPSGDAVATFASAPVTVAAGTKQSVNSSTTIANPKLWGPAPAQTPNMYTAVTTVSANKAVIDTYSTPFGIRSVIYDGNKGILVNGQHVRIQGTCNHHDQGALGAAFHIRAEQRRLEKLQEMGGNALRTSHNPPAPEFLDLADKMGFVVLDEIFDCWNSQKNPNDFHLIFADWKEPDLRNMVRRDRNHPSVIAWSFGNEVGEQGGAQGGTIAKPLHDIVHEEDPTGRPTTAAMNSASPGNALPNVLDLISLNYQGEGLGTSMSGSFPGFHKTYPDKVIWSSESASALSTRGTFLFPVTNAISATVGTGSGGDAKDMWVSAYELYAPGYGSSADKVFQQQDKSPFVAGEFVWTGTDYLGEPNPYNNARSSYFGIIDLAGFPKDRFYIYQARWRPDFPMAHILPHWTWPADRNGEVTPVHVFTSGDEAELFVNGKSAGRQKRGQYDYRLRWSNITYAPGDLKVVAYKDGKEWATAATKTAGAAAKLNATADRTAISGSSDDNQLSYVSVAVTDADGTVVPTAATAITFSITGPGQIIATDNGDPTDMTAFPSLTRKAFSGWALAIVKANPGGSGPITVTASATGLTAGTVIIQTS